MIKKIKKRIKKRMKIKKRIFLKEAAMPPITFLSMFTSTKSGFLFQKKKERKKEKEKLNITKSYKTVSVGIYKT